MFVKGMTVVGLFVVASGCATIPDGAPQEFHDAKAAIDRMEKKDADESFPKTAERASDSFDEALVMLKNSEKSPPESRQVDAVAKAKDARLEAEGATRMHEEVKNWDSHDTAMRDALAMLNEAKNPTVDTAATKPISPFAKLKGTEFVSTVAFFETNRAELPIVNDAELKSLVSVLDMDPNYQVILTGHADSRGDQKRNLELGLKRARTVAQALTSRGVQSSQVIVESAGEDNARRKAENPARLQLDRMVKAKLVLR